MTDGHDLQLLANGNYLLMSYKPRAGTVDLTAYGGPADATVLDAEIQELEPDGTLVWSWNSKDHIGLEETDHWWDDFVLDFGLGGHVTAAAHSPNVIEGLEIDGGWGRRVVCGQAGPSAGRPVRVLRPRALRRARPDAAGGSSPTTARIWRRPGRF